jgi:hypothetical protein
LSSARPQATHALKTLEYHSRQRRVVCEYLKALAGDTSGYQKLVRNNAAADSAYSQIIKKKQIDGRLPDVEDPTEQFEEMFARLDKTVRGPWMAAVETALQGILTDEGTPMTFDDFRTVCVERIKLRSSEALLVLIFGSLLKVAQTR